MKPLEIPKEYKYIAAFLTMRCNLSCSFCLNTFDKEFTRKRKEISGEEWVNGLNRIEPRSDLPITLSGGEPFLHRDFIYIINHLRNDVNIDLLTNLNWGEDGLERFISEVDPNRINRISPYPSIRVSYHPEQMGSGEELVRNVKKLKNVGFKIGIYAVQYPSSKQLEAITQMQFRCANEGILFRVKDFTGKYEGSDDKNNRFSILYGDYSKYPNSSFNEKAKNCLCRTSELLIGPEANVFKCHSDVYIGKKAIGNILNEDFRIEYIFRQCNEYGHCHPCDVKAKTNSKQELGHTSVEIKNVK